MEIVRHLQIEMEESSYEGLLSMEPIYIVYEPTKGKRREFAGSEPTNNTFPRSRVEIPVKTVEERKFRGLVSTDSSSNFLVKNGQENTYDGTAEKQNIELNMSDIKRMDDLKEYEESKVESDDSTPDSSKVETSTVESPTNKGVANGIYKRTKNSKVKKSVSFDPLLDEVIESKDNGKELDTDFENDSSGKGTLDDAGRVEEISDKTDTNIVLNKDSLTTDKSSVPAIVVQPAIEDIVSDNEQENTKANVEKYNSVLEIEETAESKDLGNCDTDLRHKPEPLLQESVNLMDQSRPVSKMARNRPKSAVKRNVHRRASVEYVNLQDLETLQKRKASFTKTTG